MARRPPYQSTTSLPINANPEGLISPINTTISYPQVLDPEHGPQTIHRSDLFFVNNNSQMSTRQNTDQRTSNVTSPSISNQLYPYHQQAFHHYSTPAPHPPPGIYPHYLPPQPQHLPQLPPTYPQNQRYGSGIPLPQSFPPKPIVYPTINPAPTYEQYATRPPPAIASPSIALPSMALPTNSLPAFSPPSEEEEEYVTSPTDDSNELAMALALSQSESVQRQKLQAQLRDQEEEDLARALAESLLSTESNANPDTNAFIPEDNETAHAFHGDAPPSAPSPVQTPIDILSQSSPLPDYSTNSSPQQAFPEFGLHEKWRLPVMPEKPVDKLDPTFEDNPDQKEPIESLCPSYNMLRPSATSPRPLSISSVSSLAYMRDADPEVSDDKNDEVQRGSDIDIQDGKDDLSDFSTQTNPEITATEPRSPAPWTISQSTDVYPESGEPNVLEFDDEAYARQLAAEEEALFAQEQGYANEKFRPMPVYTQDVGQILPLYTAEDQQIHHPEGSSSSDQAHLPRRPTFSSDSSGSSHTYAPSLPDYSQPPSNHTQLRPMEGGDFSAIASLTNAPSTYYSPVVYPSLGNRHESENDNLSEASHQSSTPSAASEPQGIPSGSQLTSNTNRIPSASVTSLPIALPSAGMLNANHFLDRELLLGVSIGFKAPAISPTLQPMQDPMPNIISLPYARCPPLHFQAPDWRHLLRLMARLSGTRIEPTVEAMAVSKTELKLRTVVQFIKPHPHANDWRTILWFTIDHPIPPAVPGAARYLSGNPNLLPWSYTLSSIPMLLRDAADTHISKTYTIPASESVPLPNLPITFPNLALYLQAALDASRRHSGDTTGLGKLGKVVQVCYPSTEQTLSEFDIPERTRMSDMFKRVMKRGNKDKKKGKTTNNEETYQLVTPFVPDEWG